MAQFEDLYKFNIQGNYGKQLGELRSSLKDVQGEWEDLKSKFGKGASFAQASKEIKELEGSAKQLAITTKQVAGEERRLGTASDTLAGALNTLTDQQNKLQVSRKAELITLEQARKNANPRIIQLRAEVAALRKLTSFLEKKATAERFAELAAEAGIDISKKKKAVFSAEAEALRKIARANEQLAVSEQLRARGYDPQGNAKVNGPELSPDLARKAKAEQQLFKEIEQLKFNEEVNSLKKTNGEFKRLTAEADRAKRALKGVNSAAKETQSGFSRLAFTFRRLVGVMAAFTVARKVAAGFTEMLKSAISFNASIERARVGISGLIAASAEVRSPGGDQLGIDDQLLRSQDLAIDQMNKLRVDALATAGSYDELKEAFQTAIAPGQQAGLTLDQIRKITVDISQAATGLGVAQNQLAEEIRSLVQGTITPKNTRVATALGISNADIRRARELGNLFEFLQTRFEAISKTGVKLMDTFTAQLSNASDAFQQLLEKSSKPLFLQLKDGIKQFQDAIFSISDEKLLFNPNAIRAFEGLFDGLARGVEGITNAFSQLDAQGLADSFGAVGDVLGLAATVVANALKTAFNLATPLLGAFNLIVAVVTKIGSFLNVAFGGVLGTAVLTFGRLLVIVTAYNFVVAKSGVLWKGIVRQVKLLSVLSRLSAAELDIVNVKLKGIRGLVVKITALARRLLIPLVLITGAILAIDQVLAAFGSDFSVFDAVSGAFAFLNDKLDSIILGSKKGKEALDEMSDPTAFGLLVNRFTELNTEMDELGRTIDNKITAALATMATTLKGIEAPALVQQQLSAMAQAFRQLDETARNTKATLDDLRKQEKKALESQPGQLKLTGNLDDARARLSQLGKDLKNDLKEADEVVKGFNKALFGQSRGREPEAFANRDAALAKQASIQKQITENLKLQGVYRTRIDESLAKEVELAGIAKTARESIFKLEARSEELRIKATTEYSAAVAELNAKTLIQQRNARLSADGDLKQAQASLLIAQGVQPLQAELLQADAKLIKQRADFQIAQRELLQGALGIQDIIKSLAENGGDRGLIESLQVAKNGYLEQEQQLTRLNELRQQALLLEKERARLLGGGGDFGDGFNIGLQDFKREAPTLAQAGQNFAKSAADGLANFGATSLAQSVAAAFDPNKNFDLKEAAGNFLQQLGTGLLTDFLKGIFKSLITEKALDIGKDTLDAAAKGADALSNAADTGAEAASQAAFATSVGVFGSGAAVFSGAVAAFTAASSGQTAGKIVGALGQGSVLAGATGGAVNRMRRFPARLTDAHRNAPGFARGGRPRSIDPRDTIPAWLRPGEWVIRPESVSKYGDGLFDMLNRGQINPALLRSLSAGAPAVKAPRARTGFATGGKAPSSSRGSSAAAATPTYQFFDEQVLDRALASGSASMIRYTRRRRSDFRAALGLEAGS